MSVGSHHIKISINFSNFFSLKFYDILYMQNMFDHSELLAFCTSPTHLAYILASFIRLSCIIEV